MKKNNQNNFEISMKKLEDIIDKIESGDASLEDSISMYEEGIELKKLCEKKLKEFELKIKKIKLEDGKIIKKDLNENE